MSDVIFTIGYQQATQATVVSALPCYGRDAAECHRSLSCEALFGDFERVDLVPALLP